MKIQLIYFLILILMTGSLSSCDTGPKKPVLNDQQMKELQEPLMRVNRNLTEQDKMRIEKYIQRKGWKMNETETGLYYEILETGQGDSIRTKELVSYKYVIYQLGGDTLYTDKKDGIRDFYVDQSNTEEGLNQAVQLMTRGTKARLILSPHLAFGLRGDDQAVPARAILVYELKLLENN